MFASHYKLSNLCVMLDRNHLQIDGTTETVMNSDPLEEKLKAFNFNVLTINGHDYDDRVCYQGFPRGERQAHLHHSGYPQGYWRLLYENAVIGTAKAPTTRNTLWPCRS